MSSIATVSSGSYQVYQSTSSVSSATQSTQALNAIGTAISSGDVPDAQEALSNFQGSVSDGEDGTANLPFGSNVQANADYSDLVTALQSGKLSDAADAYSKLQSDLKPAHRLAPQAVPVGSLPSVHASGGHHLNVTV